MTKCLLTYSSDESVLGSFGSSLLTSFHSTGAKNFAHQNPQLMIIPMVGTIVLICVISCCENLRRQSPTNIILLAAFTLCESVLVGFISSTYQPKIVSLGLKLLKFQAEI